MTKRLKRLKDFGITLNIKNDAFINPPRVAQRNWLLNKAVAEFATDVAHLDTLARRFVPGGDYVPPDERTQAHLDDAEIMEDWQIPLMQAMADVVTETHGDILEIGFGRGISADFVQAAGVKSHTIVECNDAVVERFHQWRSGYPEQDIRLIHGKWQETVEHFSQYDGILFHTYPLDEAEYLEYVAQSVTFAEHFFSTAAAHLRPGGTFTYFTGEIDSFSRAHQRLVLQHFSEFTLRLLDTLEIPEDVMDTWWSDSIVVIKARK